MKIKEIIINGANRLKRNQIEDSNIKAKILLQHILQQDKSYLTINSEKQVSKQDEKRYNQYIQELLQGKPLQYITHIQEFMGIDFYVDENVLIPQPDTEILVEETIKEIEDIINYKEDNHIDKDNVIRILDICTGSGAIAISIDKYFKEKYKDEQNIRVEVYGLDVSEEALKIAERNANTNQVHVTWLRSDMFKEIEKYEAEPFDIIVSNPPYIQTDIIKTLPEEVKQEPYIALDGGKDGLDFYRIIAKEGKKYLKQKRIYFIGDRI